MEIGDRKFQRYAFTKNGISPRALPGTEGTVHVAVPRTTTTKKGFWISDMFTSPPVRRKVQEKRMKKMALVLKELPAPKLEGPADADVTLVGWGSSKGVNPVRRLELLTNAQGVGVNRLHFKYHPSFHSKEASEILVAAKAHYLRGGQLSRAIRLRHPRAGVRLFGAHDMVLKCRSASPLSPIISPSR